MIKNKVGPDICVTEGGKMIGFYDGRELIENEVDGNSEPYIGMEFESEEAAMVFYDAYAELLGFIILKDFVNNKKTERFEVRRPGKGCKAMIIVRKDKSGKGVVTKLETVHCHPLAIPAGKDHWVTVQDEKDKKIRELSANLHCANQQLAECREQLEMVLKNVEQHPDHLTKSMRNIVK